MDRRSLFRSKIKTKKGSQRDLWGEVTSMLSWMEQNKGSIDKAKCDELNSLLDQIVKPFGVDSKDIQDVFLRILDVISSQTEGLSNNCIECLITACSRLKIQFEVESVKIVFFKLQMKEVKSPYFRFLAFLLEKCGKNLSSSIAKEILIFMGQQCIQSSSVDYDCIICCCNLYQFANLSELTNLSMFSELLLYIVHTVSKPSVDHFQYHSTILHFLSFYIQNNPLFDIFPQCNHLSSHLLVYVTNTFLSPSTQEKTDVDISITTIKYIVSCLQLERVTHISSSYDIELINDMCLVLRWVVEWRGDNAVIHEGLSTLRVLVKQVGMDCFEVSSTLSGLVHQFLVWCHERIITEEVDAVNRVEILRTVQVIVKVCPLHISSTLLSDLLPLHSALFQYVLRKNNHRYLNDFLITLTQLHSLNQYNHRLLESISFSLSTSEELSFPWKALSTLLFSPFSSLDSIRQTATLCSRALSIYGDKLTDEEINQLFILWRCDKIAEQSVNGCVAIDLLLEGLLSTNAYRGGTIIIETIPQLLHHPSSQVRETLLLTCLTIPSNVLKLVFDALWDDYVTVSYTIMEKPTATVNTLGVAYIRLAAELITFSEMTENVVNLLLKCIQRFPTAGNRAEYYIVCLLNNLSNAQCMSLPSSFFQELIHLFPFISTCENRTVDGFVKLLSRWVIFFSVEQIDEVITVLRETQLSWSNSVIELIYSAMQGSKEDGLSAANSEYCGHCLLQQVHQSSVEVRQVMNFIYSMEFKPCLSQQVLCQLLEYFDFVFHDKNCQYSILDCILAEKIICRLKNWTSL